ncbi:hypothetical protein [Methylobacterium sp. A54F]
MPHLDITPPKRRCPACGAGHYALTAHCPYCGGRQAPQPAAAALPGPAPSPAPRLRGSLDPQAPEGPPRPVQGRRGPARLVALGLLTAAALGAGAFGLSRGPPAPKPPLRVAAGPAWSRVAPEALAGGRSVTLRASAPFHLRVNGERIQRIAADTDLVLTVGAVRSLELRAAGSRAEVVIAPQAR